MTKPKQALPQPLRSWAEDLARLATEASRQGIALDPRGRELARALRNEGWQPKIARNLAGLKSKEVRKTIKDLRRIEVRSVMEQLPPAFRNTPRSKTTVAEVQKELRRLAEELPFMAGRFIASDATISRDIHELGYRHKDRATGKARKV